LPIVVYGSDFGEVIIIDEDGTPAKVTADSALYVTSGGDTSNVFITDTIIAKPLDMMLEIAAGRSAKTSVNKFGRSTNVDNGVSTDIWDGANSTDDIDIWVAPTQARIHNIVSSSASDDGSPAGVGARIVKIFGLQSWDTTETSEDVILNGVSSVATSNSYVIIHRIRVVSYGSSGPNVGYIDAVAQTDATITAMILPNEGQTQMAIYGIGSTKTAYMTCYYTSGNRSVSSGAVDVSLYVNPIPDSTLTGFLVKNTQGIFNSGTSNFIHCFKPYFKIDGPAIIKIQAVSTANDFDVSAGFDLILEDK